MDRIHTDRPFLGVRRLTDSLRELGYRINPKRVHRLMRKMGIMAIYPRRNLSKRHHAHKIYPYLLRHLEVDQPNQVWASDVTYIPMVKGFVYLTVIMDWMSRKILSWRLSNSLDSHFCIDALHSALDHYAHPDIFNSDQGVQYTSEAFTGVLNARDIRISMDGKGAWRDNVFVERLWRSLKYEEVYLNAYESMAEARNRIRSWIEFYNQQRKHQTLGATPDSVYYGPANLKRAA